MTQNQPVDVAPPSALPLPTEGEVRAELDRVMSSPEFEVPDRARKFLAYIVEEALAGRGDRIKGYSIALEVFGRDASFEAQSDPVVRIEAARIRRALERYYLVAGQSNPIIITMPKGGYVPAFCRGNPDKARPANVAHSHDNISGNEGRKTQPWQIVTLVATGLILAAIVLATFLSVSDSALSTPGSVDMTRTAPNMPKLIVWPFQDLTGTEGSRIIARGLTDRTIEQISKFREIVVIAGHAGEGSGGPSPGGQLSARYVLSASVRVDGDRVRLASRLVNRDDGSVLWAESYDESLQVRTLLELETNLARAVASKLAQPYGIIFRADASTAANTPPDDWEAYQCTLAYYGYRVDLNQQSHASVQNCLKRAVEKFPGYATAWALLSLTYVDPLRFRYRLDSPASSSLDLAVVAAKRAVELDPQNVRALQAEMLAFFFRGEVDTALKIGARALVMNPNDTEMSAEYGLRLALSGQWERGCALIADAVLRNAGPIGYFETSLALCSYMQQDYAAAERWIRAADVHSNPLYHFIVAAILGQLDKVDQAAKERHWIETIHREVAMRIHRPEDQAHFLAGLVKSGLAIP